MTNEDYKELRIDIPKQPGVYRFVDEQGTVLYVGKAKNLLNRLNSYFGNRKDKHPKTRLLVKNASDIKFTIVETETDALLLESSLIKKYQPRYNVMLKDGKTYTYICIKKERFPRVFFTRKVIKDGSSYFGPYTSKWQASVILELLNKVFQLRTCKYNLSKENIAKGKFKVCLEYHIKNCQGPCENKESEQAYDEKIKQVKNVLRGNFNEVKKHLIAQMESYAERLDFEKAQEEKLKLQAFEDYQGKSTVVSTTIHDVDVFAIAKDEQLAFVNYLKVVNGAIINIYTQELEPNLDDQEQDILEFTIPILREKLNSIAPEVIVPLALSLGEDIEVTTPIIGDKRKLLDLAIKNVNHYAAQVKRQRITRQNRQTSSERILKTLQKDLQMKEVPMHIECFDNSNLQGSHPVSSCVVFKNGKPAKQEYRHYNIKTVEGPNDFASMEEVVYRRYHRLLRTGKPLPQLIIIDGGKGQLSSAVKSLEQLGILEQVTVIGIAKRLEEIFFPNDSIPLYINKKSESLKLIQQARNEAHRFAVTFHRTKRSQNFTQTELTQIKGVGKVTAERLLQHFKAVKNIKAASETELSQVVGKGSAKLVYNYFKTK